MNNDKNNPVNNVEDEFKANEDENWEVIKKIFEKSKSENNAEKKALLFGKGLGYIWGVHRARGKTRWLFKSLKRGVAPLSRKIEKFVKVPKDDEKKMNAFGEVLTLLARSVMKKGSKLRSSGINEALTSYQNKAQELLNEYDSKDKSMKKRRLSWLNSYIAGALLNPFALLTNLILSFTEYGEGEKSKIEGEIEGFCKNLKLEKIEEGIIQGMKAAENNLLPKYKKFDELMKEKEKNKKKLEKKNDKKSKK